MGGKEFKFCEDEKCDNCGEIGAFDIYGDYLCSDCLRNDESEANAPLWETAGHNSFNWNKP